VGLSLFALSTRRTHWTHWTHDAGATDLRRADAAAGRRLEPGSMVGSMRTLTPRCGGVSVRYRRTCHLHADVDSSQAVRGGRSQCGGLILRTVRSRRMLTRARTTGRSSGGPISPSRSGTSVRPSASPSCATSASTARRSHGDLGARYHRGRARLQSLASRYGSLRRQTYACRRKRRARLSSGAHALRA
jgi:hypothetical protein